jgi:hypothetical protein
MNTNKLIEEIDSILTILTVMTFFTFIITLPLGLFTISIIFFIGSDTMPFWASFSVGFVFLLISFYASLFTIKTFLEFLGGHTFV